MESRRRVSVRRSAAGGFLLRPARRVPAQQRPQDPDDRAQPVARVDLAALRTNASRSSRVTPSEATASAIVSVPFSNMLIRSLPVVLISIIL